MKKLPPILITLLLFIFSLYYTNKGINLLKMNDPLMKEIINKSSSYYIAPKESIITNNTFIPGENGRKVNLNKSYDKIKKLGYFNENLLVFDIIKPRITYKDILDKIIIPRNNKEISLIFTINNIDLYYDISNILSKYSLLGNYYLTNDFQNKDEINNIKNIILANNLNYIKTDLIDYCIVFNLDNNPCKNKKHTILSKINIDNYHLTNTKNNLNYPIINYTFNKNNITNLSLIINYLINNQYKIVSLDDLLN